LASNLISTNDILEGIDVAKLMKTFLAIFLAGSTLLLPLTSANAASCAAKANSVAAQNGGQVLAVSAFQKDGATMCRITVLVKSADGGPARKKTVVVRK
jgi:uncharacterized protein (DUF1499 family)